MTRLVRVYDRLLAVLAGAAGVAFAAIAFIIAYEVLWRALGWRPPVWPSALSEYTLLYATALGAPHLLHRSEHVIVTTAIVMLSPTARRRLERVVAAIGTIVCLIVAWYGLQVTLKAQGLEIRSFEMPRWLVYAPVPVGFLLLAIEFFRHFLRGALFVGDEIEYLDRSRKPGQA